MRSIIEVLTRIKRILELVEIRQTEYNQAAIRECFTLIDSLIEAVQIATQKTSEKEDIAEND